MENEKLYQICSNSTSGADRVTPYDMETDSEGNSYITGTNDVYDYNDLHIFENSDGSLKGESTGKYFIAKINSNGVCKWIKGANYTYYGAGEQLILEDDSLYVYGIIRNNNPLPVQATFLNDDGLNIDVDFEVDNRFMAQYDTSGYITQVIFSGVGENQFYNRETVGFFKHSNGAFYKGSGMVNSFASFPNVYHGIYEFGDSIVLTAGRDAWATKFYNGCGVRFNRGITIEQDTTICLGNNFTFPSGNTITNVTNFVSDTFDFGTNDVDTTLITNMFAHNIVITIQQDADSIFVHIQPFLNTATMQWVDCNDNFSIIPGETGPIYHPQSNGSYGMVVDDLICQDTACYDVIDLGVPEFSKGVRVYPNPADQFVILQSEIEGVITVQISNLSGQVVKTIDSVSNGSKIATADLVSGVYFVKVFGSADVQKFVVFR